MYKYTRKQIKKAIEAHERGELVGLHTVKEMFLEKKPWKPEMYEWYYVPDVCCEKLYHYYIWEGDDSDNHSLKHGLVFPRTEKGKQQAIALAKKMLKISKKK